jgi:hypothetical protein
MSDQRLAPRRSRGCLAPVVGGLVVIILVVGVIAFRGPLWDLLRWAGRTVDHLFTEWVPAHQAQTAVILGFAVLAFLLNWVAHVRGRLRAWMFAVVVEAGLWLLFWYGPGIPSLNELLGLDIARLTPAATLIAGAIVIAVTGALFWFLEAREEWRRYRRAHQVDDG